MEPATAIDIHTRHDAADIALCGKVSEILNRHYPEHLWMVGADHQAGLIYVELPYDPIIRVYNLGFKLHITKLGNAKSMEKKVMKAGGELLERYKLKRGKASNDVLDLARENGLDRSHMTK